MTDPVRCPGAFSETGTVALLSRAALLLSLGVLLRRGYEGLRSDLRESEESFPLPELEPSWPMAKRQPEFSRRLARMRKLAIDRRGETDREMADAAEDLYYGKDRSLRAAELLVLGLAHREPLIRVTSAVSWLDVLEGPKPALWTLVKSCFSKVPQIAEIARTALAGWSERGGPRRLGLVPSLEGGAGLAAWAADRYLRLRAWRFRRRPRPVDAEGVIVHGTKQPSRVGGDPGRPLWWQPGGDFHGYMRSQHCPALYDGEVPFSWGGNLSDDDRLRGAVNLCIWAERQRSPISVFAHSHGGNLAMQASWPDFGRGLGRPEGTGEGLSIDKLVLLSCPIHWEHYQPSWANVGSLFHVRVPLDLVVLADRLHNTFGSWTRLKLPDEALRLANVSEHRIGSRWFDHGASHDPQVWRDEQISIP